jgi:hypothetical protein
MKLLCLAAGGLLGVAVVAGVLAAGPPRAARAERSGAVELQIEPRATWRLVGRFELTGVEPAAEAQLMDFEPQISSAQVSLAPGAYVLTLSAGAHIDCGAEGERDQTDGDGGWAPAVSIWPQPIAVVPGQLTTVRIALPARPAEDSDPESACQAGSGEPEPPRVSSSRPTWAPRSGASRSSK